MPLKEALLNLNQLLVDAKIDHALIGGFALAVHGINRATGDIDILIDESNKESVLVTLKANGYSLSTMTPEVLHLDGPVRLDILLARRPISREMLARAKPELLAKIKVVGAEDLIGLKIQAIANNPKRALQDKADIQALATRYPDLDHQKIKFYADFFSMWPQIEGLLK